MRKLTLIIIAFTLILACSTDNDEFATTTNITLNFTHNWDDNPITNEDLNTTETTLVNANGDRLNINRLRYLISDIQLQNESGITTDLKDLILVDLEEENSLTYTTENLLLDGTYDLIFTFGINDALNISGAYPELDAVNFNLDETLGGGYHYMQLDGRFITPLNASLLDTDIAYNYHTISATDRTNPLDPTAERNTDTSFTVTLGNVSIENNEVTIEVQMDISQWFEDPNTWNLSELNQNLKENYDAQIMMRDNGTSVFSLLEEEETEEEI